MFGKPNFFNSSTGTNLMAGMFGTSSTPSGIFGNSSGSNAGAGGLGSSFGGNQSSSLAGLFGPKPATTGTTGGGSSFFGGASTGMNTGSNTLLGSTMNQGFPIGSNTSNVSPGTQKDKFMVSKNKDDFEVHAYNYNDKYNNYSLKMLRLQDYLNFKNNVIADEHRPHVVRYFQNFKNPKMAPGGMQGSAIGGGILGQGSIMQSGAGQPGGIFGGGANMFNKPNTGIGMGGGLLGSNTSGGLSNLFGQSQTGGMGGISGGSNIFGQSSTGMTGSSSNIFGQTNNSMQTGMGGQMGSVGMGMFSNNSNLTGGIMGGANQMQNTFGQPQLNAFGQPMGGMVGNQVGSPNLFGNQATSMMNQGGMGSMQGGIGLMGQGGNQSQSQFGMQHSSGYGYFGSNQKPGHQSYGGNQGLAYGMLGPQGANQRATMPTLPDYQSPNFQSNIQVLGQAAGKLADSDDAAPYALLYLPMPQTAKESFTADNQKANQSESKQSIMDKLQVPRLSLIQNSISQHSSARRVNDLEKTLGTNPISFNDVADCPMPTFELSPSASVRRHNAFMQYSKKLPTVSPQWQSYLGTPSVQSIKRKVQESEETTKEHLNLKTLNIQLVDGSVVSKAFRTNDLVASVMRNIFENELGNIIRTDLDDYAITLRGEKISLITQISQLKAGPEDVLVLKKTNQKQASKNSASSTDNEKYAEIDMVPKLTKKGYVTSPTYFELCRMSKRQLSSVPNFSIKNEWACISFLEPVNLLGLDLDRIVDIRHKMVEVYKDDNEKPPVGSGLNQPAAITYFKFGFGKEKQLENLKKKVHVWAARINAQLDWINTELDQVSIVVEHF